MKDLQTRLNAAADAKLEAFVNECFCHLNRLGMDNTMTDYRRASQLPSRFSEVVYGLKKLALEALQEKWREDEAKAFIERVNALAESVDELRDYVQEAAA